MHESPTIERHCDVAVIGGSAAGLAAALQLGRQRRSVIVVDAGEPRNAPATHMHSYLGHEGIPPSEFTAIGRDEVRSYGVEVLPGCAVDVTRDEGRFRVAVAGGVTVIARRVLAATGLVDELPDIEGIAEQWGHDVIHCPFCHGYEVRDLRVAQIVSHPMALHAAVLFRQLTARFAMVLHGEVDLDHATLDALRAAGVDIIAGGVRRVLTDDDGHVIGLELADGDRIDADAVVVGPRFKVHAAAFASLGLEPAAHLSGLGDHIETDANGETSVPGLYAAGNVTDPTQHVLQAAANGSRVGAVISFSLADDDLVTTVRASAGEADWDHRYSGSQLWSGNPNGTLVNEITGLAPGRALDVGAGEGGDAVWLAEHGWHVTANDISKRALERLAATADQRNLAITYHHADANGHRAFETEAFDLVSAQYASIPRTPDQRGVRNLIDAVAPGGTLLVVGHDLEPRRESTETHGHINAFDPHAYVRVHDFVTALAERSDWHIETHEKRPRPPGAASASHHVDDIVLRAQYLGPDQSHRESE